MNTVFMFFGGMIDAGIFPLIWFLVAFLQNMAINSVKG